MRGRGEVKKVKRIKMENTEEEVRMPDPPVATLAAV